MSGRAAWSVIGLLGKRGSGVRGIGAPRPAIRRATASRRSAAPDCKRRHTTSVRGPRPSGARTRSSCAGAGGARTRRWRARARRAGVGSRRSAPRPPVQRSGRVAARGRWRRGRAGSRCRGRVRGCQGDRAGRGRRPRLAGRSGPGSRASELVDLDAAEPFGEPVQVLDRGRERRWRGCRRAGRRRARIPIRSVAEHANAICVRAYQRRARSSSSSTRSQVSRQCSNSAARVRCQRERLLQFGGAVAQQRKNVTSPSSMSL